MQDARARNCGKTAASPLREAGVYSGDFPPCAVVSPVCVRVLRSAQPFRRLAHRFLAFARSPPGFARRILRRMRGIGKRRRRQREAILAWRAQAEPRGSRQRHRGIRKNRQRTGRHPGAPSALKAVRIRPCTHFRRHREQLGPRPRIALARELARRVQAHV